MSSTTTTVTPEATDPIVISSIEQLLLISEQLKKKADLLFAKCLFEEAIKTYAEALCLLSKRRGHADGEVCAIKCFANQAACLIKLKNYEKAVQAVEVAISIPSVNLDIHMYSKLWHRRFICQEAMGNLPQALYSLDRAIGIIPSSEEFLSARDKLIEAIATKHGIVPLPDMPSAITVEEVDDMIKFILQNGGQPQIVGPRLELLVNKRGNLDLHNKDGKNILWALCQVAVMRTAKGISDAVKKIQVKKAEEENNKNKEESSNKEGEKKEEEDKVEILISGDDVFSLLELVIKGGAKSEQRYVKDGNKTPLQLISLAGAVRSAQLLIKTGASSLTVDEQGWNPLLVALSPTGPNAGRNNPIVQILIENSADPNACNAQGIHPLSLACQSGDIQSVLFLLSKGSKINLRDKMGFSPMVWTKVACRNQVLAPEIVKILLQTAENIVATVPNLMIEIKEDMKCCDLSGMLAKLEAALAAVTKQVETEEISDEEKSEKITTSLLSIFISMFNIPKEFLNLNVENILLLDTKNSGRCNNIYEVLYIHLMTMLPNSLNKRWKLNSNSTMGEELVVAVNNDKGDAKPESGNNPLGLVSVTTLALKDESISGMVRRGHPLEQCWLNILLSAAKGPCTVDPLLDVIHSSNVNGNSGTADENLKFYQNKAYLDYLNLIENHIRKHFGSVIPVTSTMEYICANYSNLLILNDNSYWFNLLNLYNKKRAAGLITKTTPTANELNLNFIKLNGNLGSNIEKYVEDLKNNIVNNNITNLLLIIDYTDGSSNFNFYNEIIKTFVNLTKNHGTVLLYEVFYNYNEVSSLISNYPNENDCFASKILTSNRYKSQNFNYVIPFNSTDEAVTQKAIEEGKQENEEKKEEEKKEEEKPKENKLLPAVLNSSNIYMISTPSFIFKKSAVSVWKLE
jgi:tetratricopeptide (TPR) repeat protein